MPKIIFTQTHIKKKVLTKPSLKITGKKKKKTEVRKITGFNNGAVKSNNNLNAKILLNDLAKIYENQDYVSNENIF